MNAQTSKNPAAASKASAEKKKLMGLLGLVLVGLLLWGRVLIQKVPRTVVAEPAVAEASSPDSSPTPVASAQGSKGEEERKAVTIDLPNKLSRDLFALDASRYTRVHDDSDIRPQEKSGPQAADVSPRVTAGNSGLALQATILGDHPCAVINGQVIRVGQKIKGFTLRKVLPQRVIMEMDGTELTLTK